MSLPGQVDHATPSVLGFDSDTIVTAALAQQFFSEGYKFCLRYLSLGGQESPQDLSSQEATDILDSGLALMPVQHVRQPGWLPSGTLGQQYGEDAATNAESVGFPTGINVWCDLEGAGSAASAQDVIDYCAAWFAAVDGAGFIPGLYVGPAAVLTGPQLYSLPFEHYWRSQSRVPDVPTRGYALIQLFPSVTANGIGIDVDFTQNDNEGSQVLWLRVSS
jgi:hypothetical protein